MDVREFIPHRLMPTLRWTNESVRAPARQIRWLAARLRRNTESKTYGHDEESHSETIRAIKHDGYVVLPGAFSREGLVSLRADVDTAVARGIVYPIARNPKTPNQAALLSDAEVAMGEDYIEKRSNIVYVRDPLITCRALSAYVFSDLIIDIATEFYGCRPSITGCYLMKSFTNKLPEAGFNFFHCDNQSARFIKFFLYLNDVGLEGGPFCYVPRSHLRKPFGWRANNMRSLSDIEQWYGVGAALRLTAQVGDLIIANTTGFHCAEKPKRQARYAFMINTGLHPIRHTIATTPKLARDQFHQLNERQRAITDFMQIV